MNRTYGWKRSTQNIPDRVIRATQANLPSACSLAIELPPVYDQGSYGSCTANAWAALYQYRMRHMASWWTPSRLFLYWNERQLEGTTDADDGAEMADGGHVLQQYGAVPESLWPYTEPVLSQPTATLYPMALANQVVSYAQVAQDVAAIKTAIWGRMPVAFGFLAFAALESEDVAASGVLPMPAPDDTPIGGHAVAAVGWRDDHQSFICRNSWGAAWGQNGYFEMPYAYALDPQLAADFYVIDTEV